MASISRYISVLKPATQAGSLQLTVRSGVVATANSVFAAAQSFSVTVAISGAMSEEAYARAIYDALQAAFVTNTVAYAGIPAFEIDAPPPFTLRAWVSGHVASVWSQVDFGIDVVSDGTGGMVKVTKIPIFPTIADAMNYASIYGIDMTDAEGNTLCDDDIAARLLLGSQMLYAYAGGYPMVATQFLHEEVGNWTDGFNLPHYPILYHDFPVSRTAWPVINNAVGELYNIQEGLKIVSDTGEVGFARVVGYWGQHPLDGNSMLRMTYVAGPTNVDDYLRSQTVLELAYLDPNMSLFSEVHGGEGGVKIRKLDERTAAVRSRILAILGRT